MITIAAGQSAALVWQAGAVLTGAQVTISPAAGGAAVFGPTAAGLGVSGTTYSLVWQVPSNTPQGSYTAVLSGTSGVTPVEVELPVFVSLLPLYETLAEIKERLKITDTDRDARLARLLASASRSIDKTTSRRFYLDPSPVARVLNPRGRVTVDGDGWHLLTADIGDVDDLAVDIGRAPAWSDVTAQVEAEPTDALEELKPITSLLRISGSWPDGGGQRVRVTARWGWPAVPDEIREATALLTLRLFKRTDSPEGVLGSSEWGVVRVSRQDPDVYALIERYILPGFA
ncbi:phage head-tail connector protein [Streptomyces galilaeus]|uniref:Phage head-tail connector protein n=1 Tax=Streptomyces galilaeus TaxID=33899 RepID=A0ABW9IFL4_STRGJ